MCAVDCVDFPFVQILIPDLERPGKLTWNTSLNSEKLHGPGLHYECAWSILSNDIVHFSGPWLPGDWNDISIFRAELKDKLDDNERIIRDKGLKGEAPEKVICLNSMEVFGDLELTAWCQRIEGRFETGFNRIKRFNCTKSKLKCKGDPGVKWDKHEMMITACVVITQIEQELGIKVLYDTETDGYEYETYERK